MFGPTTAIKLDKSLFERVKRCADAAGYSSPAEFVTHLIEKELAQIEEGASDEEILKSMQGLGYLE